MKSVFLVQKEREKVIRDACNYLTYINRGEQLTACKGNHHTPTSTVLPYQYSQRKLRLDFELLVLTVVRLDFELLVLNVS